MRQNRQTSLVRLHEDEYLVPRKTRRRGARRQHRDHQLFSASLTGFTIGSSYKLGFSQSSEIDSNSGRFDDIVNVQINGAGSLSQDFSAISVAQPGRNWADWLDQSMTFTADATNLTFRFQGVPSNCAGPRCDIESGIDNMSIEALDAGTIPEPNTIALFGLGLFGFLLFRRSSQAK